MPTVEVNWVAIVVAVVASMVLGYVWYSMGVFGRRWMELIGKKEEDLREGAGAGMAGMLVSSGVTAYVLTHFVSYAGADTAYEGAVTGFWIWLGFMATVMLSEVFFEKRPFALFTINAGYQLVNLLVMGAILVKMS